MVVLRGKRTENGWWQRLNQNGEIALAEETTLGKELHEKKVDTISSLFNLAAEKFGPQNALGTRIIVNRVSTKSADGKMMEKIEFGNYRWMTYSEFHETSQSIGWALNQKGFGYQDRVALFAETRAEWLVAAAGALQHRISVCTIYTNLSDNGAIHALSETEVPLVFTSFDLLPRLLKLVKQAKKVVTIVVMEDQMEGVGNTENCPDGVEVISFRDFVKIGQEVVVKDNLPVPKKEDTAIIMYTSGSTGTPKGVEITHSNIFVFVLVYSDHVPLDENSKYLAFLPLAHIMELVTEVALMANGVPIYYSSPLTLTSSSLKIYPGTDGDAKVAKPTHLNCVPLILDKVIKSVTQKVEQGGWLKSFIFNKLVNYKFWIDYIPITSTLIDLLIFQKVRTELGGCLKYLVVGGAPLSIQTQEKFSAMFGCKLLVGYGSTETSACVSVVHYDDHSLGHTGAPNASVLIKLADWEEGGYRSTDEPNPRGEIIVGGPSVAKGYFKMPEETESSFFVEDGERWFQTGDIGEMDHTGCLKIVDRMKDFVKMKHGEYVSLGSIESVLKTLPIVDNICIFADGLADRTVAVIVPVPAALVKLSNENNGPSCDDENDLSPLYLSHQLNYVILKQIHDHGKECGLSKFEIPAAIHLTNDMWTPDSNLVTAALKLRRKQLSQHYAPYVKSMLAALN